MAISAQKAPFGTIQANKKFKTQGIAAFAELHQAGEIVYMTAVPGVVTNYLVFSPEIAHDILVKNPEKYHKPELAKKLFRSSFGNGLFFSEDDFWRRQRKLAQPAFHHMRINAYADRMVEQASQQISRWQSGSTLDIDQEMHALTLIIVIDALFKTDISGLTREVGEAMKELGAATQQQILSPVHTFLPNWVPTALNRRKQHAVEVINRIIYGLIADHRQSGEDTGDLLSVFIQACDEETGERMSDLQIRDELMTMFIAGHETSAVALSWALLEIAQNPEIAAKLQVEVDSALQGRVPTLGDLPNLPYTQQVVKETLRLYPPAVFISRCPIKPMELGGKRVRSSDLITIVLLSIQRDARWFTDPDIFNPDRFVPDFEKTLPKGVYMPFGSGPRVCIGNGFAMLEMQLVLATLLQRFRFVLPENYKPIRPSFNITLGFQEPLKMQVIARSPQVEL
jgi:cytochrome P450